MISIIVPIYKVEPYLRQCIDSILNQTYKDIEVLLIDDGSPDMCGIICDEYAEKDNRIRVFHTENRGLASARNLGLLEARGQYIGFVDSDDWIEPEMYEIMSGLLRETDADICTCGLWHDSGINNEKNGFNKTIYNEEEALEAMIDGEIKTALWNKLYRTQIFTGIAFPAGKVFEDIATIHFLISKSRKVTVSDAPLYHYRQRSGSITKVRTAQSLIDYADACLSRYNFFMDAHQDLFDKRNKDILRLTAEGICKVWRWWYGCDRHEKKNHQERIIELVQFTRKNIPLFGYRSWPYHLRLSSLFMHSRSGLSFATMFGINQIYRKFKVQNT